MAYTRKVANKSLRYMDAYRKGATGRLAAFANKKYTSHRCLPESWLDECMAEYKAAFGEAADESMVNLEAVEAELAALGADDEQAEAEGGDDDGEEAGIDGDDEEVDGDDSDEEGAEVRAEDDEEVGGDDSSSEELDAAAEVAAARADRNARRDNESIAVLEERAAAAAPAVEGGVNAQGRPQRRRDPVNYSEYAQSQNWIAMY